MMRRAIPLTAVLALLVPGVASSQPVSPSPSAPPSGGFTVQPPPGWQRVPEPPGGPTLFKISVGTEPHLFGVTGQRATSTHDVSVLAHQMMDAARAKGDTVDDQGALTICAAQPAWRWTVHITDGSLPTVERYLVTAVPAGFAIGTYAHREGAADRDDAVTALNHLCASAPGATSATAAPLAVPPSYTFVHPAGWRPTRAQVNGIVDMTMDHAGTFEMITVFALPPGERNLDVSAAQLMDLQRKTLAITDEGRTTVCGQPAYHWTATNANARFPSTQHDELVQTSVGLVHASYSRPSGVPDRPDALDAIAHVCPPPLPNPAIAGWTSSPVSTGEVLTSPDGHATFDADYFPVDEARFTTNAGKLIPPGTTGDEGTHPCGSGTVHRVDVTNGAHTLEVALVYLNRVAYKYVYTRPAGSPSDPAAERALTAVCTASP